MSRPQQVGLLVLMALGAVGASSSPKVGSVCESDGPLSLRPKSYDSIRIGMTRAKVEGILGSPDYSPIDGQDYSSTDGECEVAPGRTAGCGYIIEYRDYSKTPLKDTGRVVECSWGAIGE
jgi:hypothetical protein